MRDELDDDDRAAVDRYEAASVYERTADAVEAARAAGVITDMDEGTVAVLLRIAERLDDPDFPYVEGRFDNVSEGLYVKTARELGLTVAARVVLPEKKEGKRGKLAVLRAAEAERTG